MKQQFLRMAGLLGAALVFGIIFLGCADVGADNGAYSAFYQYPAGRTSEDGMLAVTVSTAGRSAAAGAFLVFMNTVAPENYLGTVQGAGTIKVALPEEKFYSILAVSKAAYERDGLDAPQAGNLAYYSNTQAGQVSVFVDDTDDRDAANRPGGALRINNNTPFWLALYKAGSSSAYAVLPPQTRNISVPLQRGKPYSYIPRVFQKLTYNNKVMAFTETPCPDLADTVLVTDENPIHTITINSSDVSIDMAPAVLLTNTTAKAVEVYYRADPPGSSGTGTGKNVFVVPGGGSRALLTGFEAGQAINGLRFKSPPWEADKTVQAGPVMANNQVYLITLTEDGGAMTPSTNENPNPAPASAFLEE